MPIDAPPPVVQQVIVSPRAGQRVTRPPLRLVVRAGREHSDLVARLNGVSIGDDFVRSGGTLRRLNVSASHGLRHGRNVLTVRARIGTTVRRQRVVFTIANKHPIPGAGRHRHTVTGRWIRLQGRVVKHPRGERASAIRWSVVQAPKGSRLRTATRAVRASRAAVRRALARGIRRPANLRPSFRPDKPGRYVLKLTIGRGVATRSATVAVEAGPVAGAVAFDSAVDGAAPAGASDDRTPYGRPGIRVGAVVYRAPWMAGSGKQGAYAGLIGETQYRALWQVLVLDRRTLAPLSSSTYGRCDDDGAGGLRDYLCAVDAGSERPVNVDLQGRLAALGGDALVIVASHPSRGGQYAWDTPEDPYGGSTPLTEVGFPADPAGGPQLMAGAAAGGVALVGVGGLSAGAGRYDVASSGGEAQLSGQLVADVLGNYGYVSGQRRAFDTRAQSGCVADGSCAAAVTVGGGTLTTSTPANSASGLLVAAYDERTLALRAKQELVSGAGSQPGTVLADLAAFIAQQSRTGTLFVVSSFGSAMLTEGVIDRASSTAAGSAIVSIGGTLDGFYRAISTGSGGGYALIGWAAAGAGKGVETSGANARLQGALAPDAASHMRPANVSADGPPAEQLQQLLVAAPSTAWRYDDDPDRKAAILWIGDNSRRLGGDPRQAYWQLSRATLDAALQDVEDMTTYPPGVSFSARAFADATAQVRQELQWAGEVRDYLTTLAAPAAQTSGSVWEQATILQNRLTAQLRIDTQTAKANAFWMGVVESVLDLAGGLGSLVRDSEKFGAAMASMAAGLEAAQAGWAASESGAAPVDSVPRVAVDDLATSLQTQSQQTIDSFWKIGNAIISDPAKLAGVGANAGCLPNTSRGCARGFEQFQTTDAKEASNAASTSLERVLYQQIVPISYPVWNTGMTRSADPDSDFTCISGSWDDPFTGAPRASWAFTLEQVATAGAPDPIAGMDTKRWRVWIMAGRTGTTYLRPADAILARMYGAADPENPAGPLGLLPAQVLSTSTDSYVPAGSVSCNWRIPGSGLPEPG